MCGLIFALRSMAQIYDTNNVTVTTFAGSAFSGYLDGTNQQTFWNAPTQITSDSSSNLFVWDSGNDRIRKITPSGTVTTFAGGGAASLPAVGTNANLSSYDFSVFITIKSNVMLARYNSTLFAIQPNGLITKTNFPNSANGFCLDSTGNIYYTSANLIYRWFTNGSNEVFVGSGNSGGIDGNGIFTSFSSPTLLACDGADNIWVWDASTRFRRVNQNRDVTTPVPAGSVADGSAPRFTSVNTMFFDAAGNLILGSPTCIRKLTVTTNATTFAGSFSASGYTNGPGNLARFSGAAGVCLSGGSLFVADANNNRIRQISFNNPAQEVSAANLAVGTFAGLKITGLIGRTYRIESSHDLSAWNVETSLILAANPQLWIDPNAAVGQKFYRAVLLP